MDTKRGNGDTYVYRYEHGNAYSNAGSNHPSNSPCADDYAATYHPTARHRDADEFTKYHKYSNGDDNSGDHSHRDPQANVDCNPYACFIPDARWYTDCHSDPGRRYLLPGH